MVNKYKKEYDWVFKSKDEDWRLKHNYKKLKDLDYQPDQPQQHDQSQQPDLTLPLRIESEDEFNRIKNNILDIKDSRLKTNSGDNQYDLNYMKRLTKNIAGNKITKVDAINEVKKIVLI